VALAAVEVCLGASPRPALDTVAPLLVFLVAALSLSTQVERTGLAERAAHGLAAGARGHVLLLYGLVCAVCALLTAVVSLDGAVVLMVPLVLSLSRSHGAPVAPLFLGVVVVANSVSIAVPQGNPTNLVVMSELGISSSAFLGHMLAPGLAAGIACAGAVALRERRALAARYRAPRLAWTPLSRAERRAALTLAGAAAAAWLAPFAGVAPWWPFAAVGASSLALARDRGRPTVPWRIAAQLAGLSIVVRTLAVEAPAASVHTIGGLLAVAGGVAAVSALANNLPVSASAAALLGAGPGAFAATIGLAVGSLATPHGSVATLVASDLVGPKAPPLSFRRLAPPTGAALLVATVLLWAGL
jgi:arsenical pump membrane protein